MELYKKVEEHKNVLKVVVLGDVNVGKSNIIRRILGEEFQELEATVGVEYTYIDVQNVDPNNPQLSISIQIWDTSGAERYRAITSTHIRDADGALLVYDITNRNSFDAINFWQDMLKHTCDDDIVVYLVGNKADLVNMNTKLRRVSKDEAVFFSKGKSFQGFGECSALRNTNINEIFQSFYKTLYKKNKNKLEEKTKRKIIQLENLQKKHSNHNKDCCS